MKTAIVPAQITTVEDRIAGNLTWQQMGLLAAPVFVDFAIYAVLPGGLALYKLILMILISLVGSSLAIRVKGKILLVWAVTIARYNVRARYYVFDKNTDYLRTPEVQTEQKAETIEPEQVEETKTLHLPELSPEEVMRLESILANPATKLSFTKRKGGLYASITEIE